jgi:hypothetical protein
MESSSKPKESSDKIKTDLVWNSLETNVAGNRPNDVIDSFNFIKTHGNEQQKQDVEFFLSYLVAKYDEADLFSTLITQFNLFPQTAMTTEGAWIVPPCIKIPFEKSDHYAPVDIRTRPQIMMKLQNEMPDVKRMLETVHYQEEEMDFSKWCYRNKPVYVQVMKRLLTAIRNGNLPALMQEFVPSTMSDWKELPYMAVRCDNTSILEYFLRQGIYPHFMRTIYNNLYVTSQNATFMTVIGLHVRPRCVAILEKHHPSWEGMYKNTLEKVW